MPCPDVSVIMPAYNTLPWLGQAVESVLLQEGPSWELIIIDDGSTDGTAALARRYAALDGRIRVLDNQGQKGAGGSRNTGLKALRGRSVFFLDSDDALNPDVLAALHAALARANSPAARGRHATFCQQRWATRQSTHRNRPDTLSIPLGCFCEHLFRADFLLANDIFYPEEQIRGQDTSFLCHAYAHLDSPPALLDAPAFLYRINHKPQPAAANSPDIFLERARRIIACFRDHGKNDWIPAFVEHHVLPGWLPCLHAAQQAGEEAAMAFIAACLRLFVLAGDAASASLREQTGAAADAFMERRADGDAGGILHLLNRQGLIRPPRPYTGIARNPEEPGWRAYRLSRRCCNLLRSPETRRALLYLETLKRRAARRMAEQARDKPK